MIQEHIIKLESKSLSILMARLEKEKVLERIYYDVEEGFGSVRDLYEKARKVDVGITLDMVSAWMRAQPNKQTKDY